MSSFNRQYVERYFSDVCVEGGKTTPRGISASRLARNKIPTASPMFSGSNILVMLLVTLADETESRKSKMAAEIMCTRISANIHDSSTISTAITRFQCHKHAVKIMMLFAVWVCRKSKMVAINRK